MTIYVVWVSRHSSFYISIRDNDIDVRGAAQWANTVTALTNAEDSCYGGMQRQMTLGSSGRTSFQPLSHS